MFSSFVVAMAVAASTSGEGAKALATRIERVTVFPSHALVSRAAQVPEGGGRYVIESLPALLDPDSVRVHCAGADVVGIDTRQRHVPAFNETRLEDSRRRVRELQRDLQSLGDEKAVLAQLEQHLGRLLALEEESHATALARGQVAADTWAQNLEFITGELTKNRASQREVRRKSEELEQRLKDAQLELGRGDAGAGVDVREVEIELAAGSAATKLELEYIVASAGWRPLYDLRAARDAKSVELSYRAQVWQQSGEDWKDVEVALSTARPQLGAQGPEPQVTWLSLEEPRNRRMPPPAAEAARGSDDYFLGRGDAAEEARKSPFASVESQGLSVRFKLAQRESLVSRPEPANVLVGRATLQITPEYFTTPALDTNVWLRGKTKNTSEWTLLPGTASVYFGADFLGHAELALVQTGEEFTLHLGPDPALAIERTQLQDLTSGPGVFGSKSSRREGFRIRVKNAGAAAVRSDGSALVFVRESLPRSTDERIKVELVEPNPKPSEDERWKKEREELGILTWALAVPKNGEATITYVTKISFPEGAQILR